MPDITQRRSAQKRVTNRVREGVTIGVADRPFFKRNAYSAEHQLPTRGKSVQIISETYAMGAAWLFVRGLFHDYYGKKGSLVGYAGFLICENRPGIYLPGQINSL